MITAEAHRINETDRKVLVFLSNQMKEKNTTTLESPGLVELAIEQGVVNVVSSFSTCLARLKHYHFVESVRSGRASLYSFTRDGLHELELLLKGLNMDTKIQGDGLKMVGTPGAGKSLEEQLKIGMEQGKLPNIYEGKGGGTYPAIQGLALPKDGIYSKDIKGLQDLYRDRINGKAQHSEMERVDEWFRKLVAAGQPAYEWIQAAICITSTKVKSDQRTIAYIIGILKAWTKFGFGSDFNTEQRKMFEKFEERFGHELSMAARQKLIALVDIHGIVDTMSALFLTTFAVVDMSQLIVNQMEQALAGIGHEEEIG